MSAGILDELRARGLIYDCSDEADLTQHLAESRTVYAGFDPTADSLHIGSLLPLLTLRRFQLAGHKPIIVVGGGTGLIGDPSGKTDERVLNPKKTVEAWTEKIANQVSQFFEFDNSPKSALIVNNYDWLSSLDVITFLRDIGKHFSVSSMLAKESIRSRLDREGVGISYTEFSYMLLQAYDYLCLYKRFNCTLQCGGSDQWGNITAGIELIRRTEGAAVYGLTFPLVTKADGTKFGKTELGTVWLDPSRTSPYAMYQFWLNTADADVVKFLKYFTFLSLDEISQLEESVRKCPERREAQRVLAREVTALVHGTGGLQQAERITDALFQEDFRALNEDELKQALEGAPCTFLHRSAVDKVLLVDLLVTTGLARSKSHARELLSAGSIRINGTRIMDTMTLCSPDDALFGKYLIISRGRKTRHIVSWE